MNLTLNEAQLAVLRWIADGCDPVTPPSAEYKTSAVALHNRGLIELDRRRGHWHAELARKGAHYLAHGHHPDAGLPTATTPKRARVVRPEPAVDAEQKASTPLHETARAGHPGPVGLPISAQIRRPHPAIRELLDHKSRVDVPAGLKRRAHLILHALVEEALRRGWTVTPIVSTIRLNSWTNTRTRVWPSSDLFTIDAGSAPVGVRLRMRKRRIDHVKTKAEIEAAERYSGSYAPKYDYVATDRMCLEINPGYDSLVLDDSANSVLEDKLLKAVKRIERLTADAIAREEQIRQRELDLIDASRLADIERHHANHYGSWADAFQKLATAYSRHEALRQAAVALRLSASDRSPTETADDLNRYLTWVDRFIEESDPIAAFVPPAGGAPGIDYLEWSRWMSRQGSAR